MSIGISAICDKYRPVPAQNRQHPGQIAGTARFQGPDCTFVAAVQPQRRFCVLSGTIRQEERVSRPGAVAADMSSNAVDGTGPTVAFLGMGIMGTAMARNLLKAGYQVTIWNRSADKCKDLAAEGAKVASSAKEAAAAADITIAMLADPAAALAVAKEAAEGLARGKGYVDASTIDAESAKQIAQLVHGAGAEYLEAPVSGSKAPAEQGTLIFLTGGDKSLFERSAPLLDVMGKAKFFLGEVGNGANMKLVVNMMMGSYMAASAEGLSLAKAVGLSPRNLIEVVGLAAIATPMFALKAPAMVEGKYATAFPLKHQQKDMRLALERAGHGDLQLPVASAANKLYEQAKEKGLGDSDFSAVLESVHHDSMA